MKTATNVYLLSQPVADELFLLSVPFVALSAALCHWPFGLVLCSALLREDGLTMFTSVFCLTVLSGDCYNTYLWCTLGASTPTCGPTWPS